MEVWKIIFLSKWVICRFHVNLPGCSRSNNLSIPPGKGSMAFQLPCGRCAIYFHDYRCSCEIQHNPRKMVAKEDDPTSYWEGNFSGTMLNFGRPQGRPFGGPFPDNSRVGSTNFIAFLSGLFPNGPGEKPILRPPS